MIVQYCSSTVQLAWAIIIMYMYLQELRPIIHSYVLEYLSLKRYTCNVIISSSVKVTTICSFVFFSYSAFSITRRRNPTCFHVCRRLLTPTHAYCACAVDVQRRVLPL